ncbi:hypothetical protein ABPG73_012425 [Tetrahymena malaccensis]
MKQLSSHNILFEEASKFEVGTQNIVSSQSAPRIMACSLVSTNYLRKLVILSSTVVLVKTRINITKDSEQIQISNDEGQLCDQQTFQQLQDKLKELQNQLKMNKSQIGSNKENEKEEQKDYENNIQFTQVKSLPEIQQKKAQSIKNNQQIQRKQDKKKRKKILIFKKYMSLANNKQKAQTEAQVR